MNGFIRHKRFYIDHQHTDRQRNKQHEQIIQHFIQHLMNNSNYTNLFVKMNFFYRNINSHIQINLIN